LSARQSNKQCNCDAAKWRCLSLSYLCARLWQRDPFAWQRARAGSTVSASAHGGSRLRARVLDGVYRWVSALTVALPRLRADFGADLASAQWVLNGYVLALASLTLIGGALADVYGKARMLGLGCILFGLASAACALAPSPAWLIATRVVQGTAAAIVTPASLALIGATYPRAERNRAIGVWAAASALTTAGGPVLGGWLTETFGWPSVFWINAPLALVAVEFCWSSRPKMAASSAGST
jgi:MFS family permease